MLAYHLVHSILRGGLVQCGQYSDLIWVGWSGDQILLGMRFSAPIQTGSVAHPVSCTMGVGSLSNGQGVALSVHPPASTEVKERVDLYVFTVLWPFLACCRVNFPVTYTLVLGALSFAVE